jgi:hypothetical protein
MMFYLLIERPHESLASLALLLAGLAIFAVSVADARRRTASEVSKHD